MGYCTNLLTMAYEIKDIQKLIEQRAKLRLDNDVRALAKIWKENFSPISRNLREVHIKNTEANPWLVMSWDMLEQPTWAFWNSYKERAIVTYIEEESKMFLADIDALKVKVVEIDNHLDDIHNELT